MCRMGGFPRDVDVGLLPIGSVSSCAATKLPEHHALNDTKAGRGRTVTPSKSRLPYMLMCRNAQEGRIGFTRVSIVSSLAFL